MGLLVYTSTSGHLLVACSLEIVAVSHIGIYVHVIIITPTPHHHLWAMTIFVRVCINTTDQFGLFTTMEMSALKMIYSGMARFVRVVAHAVIKFNNPPWFTKKLTNFIYHGWN